MHPIKFKRHRCNGGFNKFFCSVAKMGVAFVVAVAVVDDEVVVAAFSAGPKMQPSPTTLYYGQLAVQELGRARQQRGRSYQLLRFHRLNHILSAVVTCFAR